jgi:hypothetical protein
MIALVYGGMKPDGSDFEHLSTLQLSSGPPDRKFELEPPATPYWRVEVLQPTNTESHYVVIAIVEDGPEAAAMLRQQGTTQDP